MIQDGKLSTRYAIPFKSKKYILISYLATKNVVRVSRVCSSLSQSGFSFDNAFFPFTVRCCFIEVLLGLEVSI